ncbi:hypothetical protein BDV38DRAFT_266025 [Aspergillus pseudotamarii]|uniref:Uncharacterized protein n=1 Tax=Aspergillus pseudotamarii TaxID=132259 RepID=A0A5N6SB04_ASPPS|nr:uncharacterized protein BDV38DRAFT_266025 [Aspergillus pseudotamarii]KAE8130870.1 hypothetical protein BDV38DRAFT_266025 [Aspergillus pseudotamarii]
MASNEESSINLGLAISAKIWELEALTRAAGDSAVSDHLKQISESENQLLSLHRALVKKIKTPPKRDTSISERRTWFSNFISHDRKRLSDKDIDTLTSITKYWALSDTRSLKVCAEIWATRPHSFCDGETPDNDVIRRCYNDLERMEDLDAIRRKVLLLILSRQVHQRQEQLLSDPAAQKRCRKTQRDHNSRSSSLLTFALDDICSRLWDDPEGYQDTRRKKLSRYSLFGWKWDRLTHKELILSLTHIAAKRFELHKWSHIKIEALNAYTETLPQFAIRDTLHKAWIAILNYYEGGTTLSQTVNPNPQGTDEPRANLQSVTSTSSDAPTGTSLGLELTSFEDISASADPWLFLPTEPSSRSRADVTDNSFEPTLSVDDIIASADPWLFLRRADESTTGPALASASAGPRNIGLTYTNDHTGYPPAASGSSTLNNSTLATLST